MILDCLIDKLKLREDVFDLCNQLDRLTDISPDLKHLINDLRKGYNDKIYSNITMYVHSYALVG